MGGLRYFSEIVHDCLQLSSFGDESSLYKRPQKRTIAHDCARIAGSGLKPAFDSPHSLTLQLTLLFLRKKEARETPKKQGFFSLRNP